MSEIAKNIVKDLDAFSESIVETSLLSGGSKYIKMESDSALKFLDFVKERVLELEKKADNASTMIDLNKRALKSYKAQEEQIEELKKKLEDSEIRYNHLLKAVAAEKSKSVDDVIDSYGLDKI